MALSSDSYEEGETYANNNTNVDGTYLGGGLLLLILYDGGYSALLGGGGARS